MAFGRVFGVPEPYEIEADLRREIIRLTEERDMWRERYEAERRDHEATIEHCDEMLRDPNAY